MKIEITHAEARQGVLALTNQIDRRAERGLPISAHAEELREKLRGVAYPLQGFVEKRISGASEGDRFVGKTLDELGGERPDQLPVKLLTRAEVDRMRAELAANPPLLGPPPGKSWWDVERIVATLEVLADEAGRL